MTQPDPEEQLRTYLSRADQDREVPAEFKSKLWDELQDTLGNPTDAKRSEVERSEWADVVPIAGRDGAGELHLVSEPGSEGTADPEVVELEVAELVAPEVEPPRRMFAAVAAAVVLIAAVGIAALLLQGQRADVATEQPDAVPTPTTIDEAAVDDATPTIAPQTTVPVELDFGTALGITAVDGDSVSFTFAANLPTAYNATIRDLSLIHI